MWGSNAGTLVIPLHSHLLRLLLGHELLVARLVLRLRLRRLLLLLRHELRVCSEVLLLLRRRLAPRRELDLDAVLGVVGLLDAVPVLLGDARRRREVHRLLEPHLHPGHRRHLAARVRLVRGGWLE